MDFAVFRFFMLRIKLTLDRPSGGTYYFDIVAECAQKRTLFLCRPFGRLFHFKGRKDAI